MRFRSLLILGSIPNLIAARALLVRSVTCDFEIAANSGDTCASFAAGWGLTESTFASLNPDVSCPGSLVAGQNYCVIGTATASSTTTAATSKTTSTTTSKSTTVTTATATSTTATKVSTTSGTTLGTTTTSSSSYQPTQSGLAVNCNNFHLVVSGDTCSIVQTEYGISATNFAEWNPSIDSACDNLWAGYYVCVGVPGATTTSTSTITSTTASSTAPSPLMPSTVSNCDQYYKVQTGDGCYSIEQAKGITADEFSGWNPYVGSTCDNLWLDYYVCVGVASSTATTTSTTATTTATSTIPSPLMPSTVSNCNEYYKVQSGDGCYAIEQAKGISSDEFTAWNPYIDAACDNLWLDYYVCVGV